MAKKILLADDSITIQKVISLTLASEDYDLIIVGDGEAAVQKAEEAKPDLVIADVTMPGKTGYEVSSFIKKHPSLKAIPVLLLAGTFETIDTKQMTASGADDHIVKPFESEDLIKRIRALLSRPAKAAPAEELPEEETLAEIEFEMPEAPVATAPPPIPPKPTAPVMPPVAAAPPPPSAPQKPKPSIAEDIWEAGDFLGGPEEEAVEAPKEEAVSDEGFDFFGLEEEPAEKPVEKPKAKEKAPEAEEFIDMELAEEEAKPAPPHKPVEAPPKPTPPLETPAETAFEFAPPKEAPPPAETIFELGGPERLETAEAEAFIAPPPPPVQKIPPPPAPVTAAPAKAGELPGAEAFGALSKEKIEEIITAVARQVVEEIAWEVVPELAEELIRREIVDKVRAAMTKVK